jgi:hypothetical protein
MAMAQVSRKLSRGVALRERERMVTLEVSPKVTMARGDRGHPRRVTWGSLHHLTRVTKRFREMRRSLKRVSAN